MSEDSTNGTPPDERLETISASELRRLVAQAQARGEDPLPIVRRAVLSTIDELTSRVPRVPDEDS